MRLIALVVLLLVTRVSFADSAFLQNAGISENDVPVCRDYANDKISFREAIDQLKKTLADQNQRRAALASQSAEMKQQLKDHKITEDDANKTSDRLLTDEFTLRDEAIQLTLEIDCVTKVSKADPDLSPDDTL